MARAIIASIRAPADAGRRSVPDGDAAAPVSKDEYADKLLKLIPAEIITLYISMTMILSNANVGDTGPAAKWVVFGFGAFATWFYLRVTMKVTDWRQLVVTVVAFCVWAYAIGDFDWPTWWNDTYSGLLLAGYTFLAPKIPMGQEG